MSLVSAKRRLWLLELLNQEKIDAAFLQETKIGNADYAQNFVRLFGNQFWCFHTLTATRAGGTAILIRKNDLVKIADCELGEDGRFNLLDALVGRELNVSLAFTPLMILQHEPSLLPLSALF